MATVTIPTEQYEDLLGRAALKTYELDCYHPETKTYFTMTHKFSEIEEFEAMLEQHGYADYNIGERNGRNDHVHELLDHLKSEKGEFQIIKISNIDTGLVTIKL